jgi:uncharacterized membrane protein
MESLILLLAVLGFIGLVGGFISIFSLLTSGDEKARLKRRLENIESQLRQLKAQLDQSLLQDATTQKEVKPVVVNLAAPVFEQRIAEIDTPEISDKELERQALAASPEAAITDTLKAAASQTKTEWKPKPKIIEPNFIEKAINAAKDWLFGGNTLVRSGIVILFIGISFLLKYAAEHSHLPIEFRMAGIALCGVALLALGWKLRSTRAEYSWAIQGGGVGIMYLTIFAALKLYQLIPPNIAFMLLIVVAFLSALIAVLQSAMPLAVLGFAGGFLAPILTSSGHGSHVGLFSYYLVLNLGIAFIAFHKNWRPINVLGFAFTFAIGTLWGSQSYIPEYFASTEPFLIIHFLLFTLIAVVYAHKQSTKASDYVDATLVFGTPLLGFSLQYALLRDSHFGLAYSALALAIFYIAMAWWILTRKRETLQFLGECFLALGIGFATLTLPLALDGRWTSAAWAVEGVGLVWVGLRQKRTFPLLAGLALQLLGAAAFANGWGLTGYSESAHQNMFLGVAFIALSGWACGALLVKYIPEKTKIVSTLLAIWGWLWWVGAGFVAIDEFLPNAMYEHASLLFLALTSLLLPVSSARLNWPRLASLSSLLLPAIAIATFAEFFGSHPFSDIGWLNWPVTFAVYAWLLQRETYKVGSLMRAPVLWLATILGILECMYRMQTYIPETLVYTSTWRDISWAIVPVAVIATLVYWQKAKQKAEFNEAAFSNTRAWLWHGCVPIVLCLLGWYLLMSLHSSGDASPLPYIPLLNPLDISLAAVLLMLLIWKRTIAAYFIAGDFTNTLNNITPPLAGLMGFALLNGMLLRTLHYWAGTPFVWTAIFDYTLVQVSFTFLWSITALILMLAAHRLAYRRLWIVGAALMGLVVLKLFMLDLAEHGSVERIISFIGAGILLLVMGYFAPLPPAKMLKSAEEARL